MSSDNVNNNFEEVKQAAADTKEDAKGLLSSIVDTVSSITTAAVHSAQVVEQQLINGAYATKDTIVGAVSGIVASTESAAATAVDVTTSTAQAGIHKASDIIGASSQIAIDAVEAGKEKAGAVFNMSLNAVEASKEKAGEIYSAGVTKANDILASGKEAAQPALEKAGALYEAGKEAAQPALNKAGALYEAGKEAAQPAIAKASELAQPALDKAGALYEAGKEKAREVVSDASQKVQAAKDTVVEAKEEPLYVPKSLPRDLEAEAAAADADHSRLVIEPALAGNNLSSGVTVPLEEEKVETLHAQPISIDHPAHVQKGLSFADALKEGQSTQ